jgi:glutathione S-transferase
MPIRLYQIRESGNCYRVRLMLALLGQTADLIEASPERDGAALGAFREVPVLVDGSLRLRDSQAILVYLARRYGEPHWLPDGAEALARIQQWLSFAANEIQNGPRMARGIVRFGRAGDLEAALRKAERALRLLDLHLAARTWLETGAPTIADVACYPYVSKAGEAGIDMSAYPALARWIGRIETLDGYVPPEAPGSAGRTA